MDGTPPDLSLQAGKHETGLVKKSRAVRRSGKDIPEIASGTVPEALTTFEHR
jgi:hypothetical protein